MNLRKARVYLPSEREGCSRFLSTYFLRGGVFCIVLRKVLYCIAQPIQVVLVDLGYDAMESGIIKDLRLSTTNVASSTLMLLFSGMTVNFKV